MALLLLEFIDIYDIYIIKIENRITFKCKTGYYLKLLIPETMILLGSTRNRTVKDENDEN